MAFGSRFLTVPDLFPARVAGEPWGHGAVRVDLAAGPYAVRGLGPAQRETLLERYEPYTRPDGEATAHLRVFRAPESDFMAIDTRGWTYAMDLDHRPDRIRIAGHRWMGLVTLGREPHGALWTCMEGGTRFFELFENFFRVLVAYRVLASGGVLLHSSGVVDAGSAYLFYGRSGAGKTTLARFALDGGRAVLSDDVNAIYREDDGEATVRRMPFAGELGPAPGGGLESFPLRGLYRLEKSTEGNEVRPMSRGRAVAALLACSPFLNDDPHRLDALTGTLERLTAEIPALSLAFDLSGDFWPCLEEAV